MTTLSTEQLADGSNFVRQFQLREVDPETREFTGIALPWGVATDIPGLWREEFERGCVEDSDTAKIFWRHVEPIGVLVRHDDAEAGWEIRGRVSKTQQGDDALTLLRDGAVDGLSVYFEPIEHRVNDEDGTVIFTRVRIREISLTPFPAHPGAIVTQTREAAPPKPTQQEEPRMTDTDTLTREQLDTSLEDHRAELERSLEARLSGLGSTAAAPAALQWRSAGDFIKAIAAGDDAAIEFHRQWNDRGAEGDAFRRAYLPTGGTTADGPQTKTWVGEELHLVNKRRKVISKFQQKPLPEEGMTLEYAQIATNTVAVGKQEAEGDDLVKGKVTVTTVPVPIGTYGGWSELSLQEAKRMRVDMVNTTHQAQSIEYAKQTEAAARAYLLATVAAQSAAGNKIDVAAAPDLFGYFDAIVDGAELFEDRGFVIDGAYASKATFKTLYRLADASNRMVFNVWGTGENVVGELSLKGLSGDLAGIKVELLTGAPTKFFTFYDDVAFTTWEEPGAPLKLQDENVINLTKQLSVHGSAAFGNQYPGAVLPLKFAA